MKIENPHPPEDGVHRTKRAHHDELDRVRAALGMASWDCSPDREESIADGRCHEIRRNDERDTKDPPRANQAIALPVGYGSDSGVKPPARI